MKKKLMVLILGLVFFASLFFLRLITSSQETIAQDFVSNEVLVKLKPEAGKEVAIAVLDALRPRVVNYLGKEIAFSDWNPEVKSKSSFLGDPYLVHIRVAEDIGTEKAISMLKNNPNVEYAEPNFIIRLNSVPNDPLFPYQWSLNNTGQTGGTTDADIDAPEAWNIFTGNQETVIAIIDTGINYNHEDLAENIWVNVDECGAGKETDKIYNDNNGYVDDWRGWDFYTGNPIPYNEDNDPKDCYGWPGAPFYYYSYHGTHVAGIAGAKGNNAIGVSGICWNAKLMSLKIFYLYYDLGTGEIEPISSTDAAIKAIDYAIANGAKIINASWGLYNDPSGLLSAISRAQQNGILFIASAGNDSSNNDVHSEYPASYYLDNIISVLMTDHNDKKSERSNYGKYSVDLGAPGGSDPSQSAFNILSTAGENADHRYLYHAGTSMAAPHVAGVAALVRGHRPYLSWWQVKTILAKSVDKISDLQNVTRYGGRINAYNALTYSTPILPDPPSGLRSFVYKRDDGWYDINLTWTDNSDDEEGFIIYRNSGNVFWEIDRVGPNTTEYWDYELPRGYYYYYIRAFNQDGESVKTPQVAAKAIG